MVGEQENHDISNTSQTRLTQDVWYTVKIRVQDKEFHLEYSQQNKIIATEVFSNSTGNRVEWSKVDV